MLMMTFHLHMKRISKPKHTRLKFDLEKLKDPNVLETFKAVTGGMFAPLNIMTPSTQQSLKQPGRSLANIIRRKNPGSLQKFLICVTNGEN